MTLTHFQNHRTVKGKERVGSSVLLNVSYIKCMLFLLLLRGYMRFFFRGGGGPRSLT